MNDKELYNKFLKNEIFEIKNPLGENFPGASVYITMEIVGTKMLRRVGEDKEHLCYKITLPFKENQHSNIVNHIFIMNDANTNKVFKTWDSSFLNLRSKSHTKLAQFLEPFGEKRPLYCLAMEIEYDKPVKESFLNESKHDTLISDIVKDVMIKLKQFKNSDMEEGQVDLPDEGEYYQTPFISGESFPFYIELYLYKTDSEDYKIDADAPGDFDENNIRLVLYFNPDKLKEQISEIKNNLIYTLRHEYEHLLQVIHDYENVNYPKTHKYKKDSLKTLLKRQEIEPQLRGYLLQSRKERKPFDIVIGNHLAKLEKNGQINFLGPERKKIVIDILVDYAQKLKLPIELSTSYYI